MEQLKRRKSNIKKGGDNERKRYKFNKYFTRA